MRLETSSRIVVSRALVALLLVTPALLECSSKSNAAAAGDADASATNADATPDGAGDAASATLTEETTDPSWAPALDGGVETKQPFSTPVYVNHSYRVVSEATFAAFGASTWLNQEFATVEQRTTDTGDGGTGIYSGAYPTFERTYLEIATPASFGSTIGISGIGLGDETTGGNDAVAQAFIGAFGAGNVVTSTRSHVLDGGTVPWFLNASINGFRGIAAWDMEYVTPPGATTPPTRKQQRAALYDPNKLARNVVALSFALSPQDTALLVQALTVVGWDVTSDGTSFTAYSPQDDTIKRAIYVVPATPAVFGLTKVGISLNRVPSFHEEILGDAKLTVGANGLPLAMLDFYP
jgi:hypothetical protein